MRALVPADSLVYLETNDLAAALQPIIDSKPFTEAAKSKPDFSALKGVQLAVAVTGFEASEEKVDEERVVGNIKPRFVAIADTHAWNFQAVGFAEQKLGAFVAKIYDGEATLEKSDKNGGKYFNWTATDNRKAYALVIDSMIYFANDESAIDKCLAVKRGETDSIIKTGKIQQSDPETLASGYISNDGVAQIANIVGIKVGSESSDQAEVQSAVSLIVPQILRNSVDDVTWTTRRSEIGYEDSWQIGMPSDVASGLQGVMPSRPVDTHLLSYVADSATSVTLYNVSDPQLAWDTITRLANQKGGAVAGEIISEVLKASGEAYDLTDSESFLSSVGPNLVTARIASEDEDRVAVISTIRNTSNVTASFSPELRADSAIKPASGPGMMTWKSDDGTQAACVRGDVVAIGDSELISPYALSNPSEWISQPPHDAAVVTIGRERGNFAEILSVFSNEGSSKKKSTFSQLIETRFTKIGIERKTNSDFGLIGWIIAQLSEN
jgi:hypothetical protein